MTWGRRSKWLVHILSFFTGLNETPMAGDHFAAYEDEKAARAAGEERAKRALLKQRQAIPPCQP